MFNYQQDRENYDFKYLKLYDKWLEDNEGAKRAKDYLDKKFFHWVGLKYRDNKEYVEEFWEMIDILIRKNMTSYKFIKENSETKDDFYSNAIHKIDKFLFNKFNENKQSLFVYATSVVTSAFYDVRRANNRQDDIKKMVADAMRGNLSNELEIDKEQTDIFCDVYSQLHDELEYDNKLDEILSKSTANKYDIVYNLKLLEDVNVPKFKRKYLTLQSVVKVKDFEDTVVDELEDLGLDFNTKDYNVDKVEVVKDKGVVVEYYDVSVFNESNGFHKNYFRNQSLSARRNGYQYFAVMSDVYREFPDAVIEKLNNLILETEFSEHEYPDDTPKHLENAYIHLEDIGNEIIEPIWYGLKEERTTRLAVDNSLKTYLEFLDNNENATRTYSFGRIKIAKDD